MFNLHDPIQGLILLVVMVILGGLWIAVIGFRHS